jgi:hypothetical protein
VGNNALQEGEGLVQEQVQEVVQEMAELETVEEGLVEKTLEGVVVTVVSEVRVVQESQLLFIV